MHVNYSFLAALVLLTIIKCGYMESGMKIWVTYLNSIHLATKYIILFNIVKHSMKVFTSNSKLTSICVNCSRNNYRKCFINIILLPLQLIHPMNANVILQDAMFIREQFAHIIHVWYYRKPTVTCDPMENETYCNLGLLTFVIKLLYSHQ